jgi:ABC-type transport system substrate-binding protein
MDRQEIISIANEGAGGLNYFLVQALSQSGIQEGGTPGLPSSEWEKQPGYRQPKDADIAEAKRLLTEAGFPNGFRTKIIQTGSLSYGENIPQIYANQLKKINVNAELLPMDQLTYTRYCQDGTGPEDIQFSCGGFRWPVLNNTLQNYWHSKGAYAKGILGWNGDPKLDAMIDAISVEMNDARRRQLFGDIQQYFADNLMLVPTVSFVIPFTWQPYMHNLCSNNSGEGTPRCREETWMELDKVPADRRSR